MAPDMAFLMRAKVLSSNSLARNICNIHRFVRGTRECLAALCVIPFTYSGIWQVVPFENAVQLAEGHDPFGFLALRVCQHQRVVCQARWIQKGGCNLGSSNTWIKRGFEPALPMERFEKLRFRKESVMS